MPFILFSRKSSCQANPQVDGRVTTDTIRFNSNGDVTTGGYSLWQVEYSDGEGTFVPYSG